MVTRHTAGLEGNMVTCNYVIFPMFGCTKHTWSVSFGQTCGVTIHCFGGTGISFFPNYALRHTISLSLQLTQTLDISECGFVFLEWYPSGENGT